MYPLACTRVQVWLPRLSTRWEQRLADWSLMVYASLGQISPTSLRSVGLSPPTIHFCILAGRILQTVMGSEAGLLMPFALTLGLGLSLEPLPGVPQALSSRICLGVPQNENCPGLAGWGQLNEGQGWKSSFLKTHRTTCGSLKQNTELAQDGPGVSPGPCLMPGSCSHPMAGGWVLLWPGTQTVLCPHEWKTEKSPQGLFFGALIRAEDSCSSCTWLAVGTEVRMAWAWAEGGRPRNFAGSPLPSSSCALTLPRLPCPALHLPLCLLRLRPGCLGQGRPPCSLDETSEGPPESTVPGPRPLSVLC